MPTEQLTDNLGNSHVVDKALSLGRGGAGLVCRFVRSRLSATHCAKLYDPSLRNQQLQDKVKYMTLNPPKTLLGQTYSLAWPTLSLFERSGLFVGFAMPQAPLGAVQLYEVSTMKLSPKLPPQWQKFDRKAIGALELRAKICANLAIAIHSVHETGQYCLGDLKPQNILLSSDGRTCVVDLDSLQISQNGQIVFPSHLVTPEYSPPEARTHKPREAIPVQWDLFSLAVCLYEVLIGAHPYAATARAQAVAADTLQGKIAQHLFVHGPNAVLLSSVPPPHALFTQLPQPVQQLFQEAFAIPVRSVVRPTAERWYEVLSDCITRGNFRAVGTPRQHTNQPAGNHGRQTVGTPSPPVTIQRPNARSRSTRSARVALLLGGAMVVAFAFFWGNRPDSERTDQLAGTDNRSGALGEKYSRDSLGTMSPTEVDQSAQPYADPAVDERISAPVRPVASKEPTASRVKEESSQFSVERFVYKDNNGDGFGGYESLAVRAGSAPPPNYVQSTGDEWDNEKLQIIIKRQPQYVLPRSCTGGQSSIISVQVAAHGGRPVPNSTLTLGLATPISWITQPKPRRGSSGAYEVVTGPDGTVSLHISPPAPQTSTPFVTLSFAVNGASPSMSTIKQVILPVCPSCFPCNTQ